MIKLYHNKKLRIPVAVFLVVVVVLASILLPIGNSPIISGGFLSFNNGVVAAETTIDSVEQTSWGYRYTLQSGDIVEVGDSSTTDFKASVKTIRGDKWFSLGLAGGTFVPNLNGLVVSFPFNSNINVSIYPMSPCDRLPDGGIEYDVILKRKIAQSTVTFNVDWSGITWQKIYGLDHDYDQTKCAEDFPNATAPFTITPTQITDATEEVLKTRPEYEVNSYLGTALVPDKSASVVGKNTDNGGDITYTRLSVTHLYIHRGQMTDATGQTAWVTDINLNETQKTLTFTLPSTWLKNATYPVSGVCGVDPAYTQAMGSFQATALASDGVWDEYDLTALAGDNVVAEIILSNVQTTTEQYMGVSARASDHTPATSTRYVLLHEAEGGGQTHCRMFVQTDANGLICAYSGDVSDADYFYVVGYWSNVAFTERWDDETPGGAGSWQTDETLTATGAANYVCQFILSNNEADTANTMGVRNTSSATNRYILIHEPEAGGSSLLDMLTKADASYKVDLYTSDIANTKIYNAGYFGSSVDFVETFQGYTNADSNWDDNDVSAQLDENGRICDFLLVHNALSGTCISGVRDGDDTTTARAISEHESEDNGTNTGEYTGFSMSAKSNSSGVVHSSFYQYTKAVLYLTGYFKPAGGGATPSLSNDPSSLNLGIVLPSHTYYAKGSAPSNPVGSGDCTFTITNDGSIAIDIVANSTNSADWSLGSPDATHFRLTIYYEGQDPASGLVMTTSDQSFYSNLAASGTLKWDFKNETPSFDISAGVSAQTYTITFTATAH